MSDDQKYTVTGARHLGHGRAFHCIDITAPILDDTDSAYRFDHVVTRTALDQAVP
jgi:hypothetical protein